MTTDDERQLVAAALRAYDGSGATADTIGEITALIIGAGDDEGWTWRQVYARLAELIEPSDTSHACRDTVACDPTERGIDSIYDWCRERLEGADGAEDYLYCSIMSAIEEYRHPERVTATTARPVDREALRSVASGLRSLGDREVLSAGAAHEVGDEIMEAIGETAEEDDES